MKAERRTFLNDSVCMCGHLNIEWIWVSVLICITLNLPSSECINPYSCMLVCILSVWSPCIGHHILIISPWLNYSAACITLCMWYTINSQLTWAKKCQPIGCAITLLSDIFMLLVVTLTSLSHLSLWLIMVSIYFSVDLLHYISLFLSLTSKQFHHCDHFVTHHLFPLSVSACFLLASFTHLFVYDYICYSSDFYASLSPICLLFASVFMWKWSMSCPETKWCFCWMHILMHVSTYVTVILWKGLWCLAVHKHTTVCTRPEDIDHRWTM